MPKPIKEFLSALTGEMPLCDAQRHGAERYGSPRLSAFDLLRTNETTLSYVLADLLDPRGTHGQGVLFLNALLRAIEAPPVGSRDPIRVTREFVTKRNRRIDILIETPKRLIGIENKPFAGQAENQLSDYHTDLIERAGLGQEPHLVFLSDSDPMTAKDVATIVRFYDRRDEYPSLFSLLNEVFDDIRAPKTQVFVNDFRDWIARQFGGQQMTDELAPYAEEVLACFERPSDRKAIGAVMLAGDRIRRDVIDQIGRHIWSVLTELYSDLEGVDGELSDRIDKRHCSWGIRRPSWPKNCFLAIESGKHGGADVLYGVVALKPGAAGADNDPEKVCSGRDKLEVHLHDVPNGSHSPWWPWYRRAPTPNWSQEFIARLLIETDGKIEEHEDVTKIVADILRLAEAIDTGLEATH